MDYFDEDCKPRFVFQSKQIPSSQSSIDQHQQDQLLQNQKPTKLFLFITITIGLILLIGSILYVQTEPFQSILFWVSLSLLIGPFAPANITGGSIRVGHGETLELEEPVVDEPDKFHESKRKSVYKRGVRSDSPALGVVDSISNGVVLASKSEKKDVVDCEEVKESEWNDEDDEMLKKQIAKNPVGKPGRWEVIAQAFKGRHKVETVIKKSKELGERKSDGKTDDYALFLKNRKQKDVENKSEIDNVDEGKKENGELGWSSGEDIALLNALKVFTKDVSMRWEKIAAAVPGKTKAACMKRVTELKKEFRSSKTS
ncbi:hypothetical protein ACFE04_031978 [Oxalis oulophora]